ncbi:MAG TPA: 30S ribosomal protein S12 methylthiotransferase RimO [Candidatus Limnocylindrales bacterium]|nr:30S ribosomal protein S12 methylthiotransferase RimO [Candidatus Limnocylindrales bacterium]
MVKEKKTENRPLRVGLISLGCAKNLVDAEIMLGSLLKNGVEITNDAAQADAVIVNTCSFIDSAQEESVDTILESIELREAADRGQAVIVSGCLPQRFRDELPRLMPEVDAFMGIDQVVQVGDIVGKAVAKRAEKTGKKHPTSNIQHPTSKGKISARLNELEKNRDVSEHEKEESLRDTEKFGKTKTVVSAIELKTKNSKLKTDFAPLFDVTARPIFIPDFETPRFRLTPKHFAYLKIAEGCNHPCSFCIIPRMRGSHRSRTQKDIMAEAKALIADGVKEINLISQDSTYYGLDLRPNHSRAISSPEKFSAAAKSLSADAPTICSLLRELNSLKADFWIRLLYTHPAHWTDELIQTIAECKKVARYVDMPLQHIHENMLERMRRETSQQYIVDLIKRIRAGVPGIALRTTFIVGFPGETEASFQTLLDFIRETKFERLGVFAYSKEDGTRAGAMAGQLSDKVKQKRRELVMAAQHKVAVAVSESFVGREIKVLVEGEANAKQLQGANVSSWEHGLIREADKHTSQMKGHYFVGRGEADAPDIDGRVYIRGKLPVGEFARVTVIGHTDYDLIAESV